LANQSKPGDLVTVSGIYRIVHDRHRRPHEGVLVVGQRFPSCRQCGDRVRFELILTREADGAPSLLVVDDEPDITFTLREILREAGYNVSTAQSSTDALSLLKRYDYDAVITEIDLEEAERGLQLARTAKQLKTQPLVILSVASLEEKQLRRAMELRINYVLQKPIDLGELQQALHRLIARRALEMTPSVQA
jgi:CheY-like chemotaxis protein